MALEEKIKEDKNYLKFERLLKEEPKIDWLKFAEKVHRIGKKVSTVNSYANDCCIFRDYLIQKTGKCIFDTLVPNGQKLQDDIVLKLLDDYVGFLDSNDYRGTSIAANIAGIKRMLRFIDIKIDDKDFRDAVEMPKKIQIGDEPPSDEEIRQILNVCSPRMRTFLLVMCESGMSMGDTLIRKVEDFKFDEDPVRLYIRRAKQYEKPFETFVTKETGKLIKQLTVNKNPTDLVFLDKWYTHAGDVLRHSYIRALRRAGLNRKIDGHKYLKYHLHVYRKRFFTRGLSAIKSDFIVHAMMGHKQYLDQYFRMPIEERRQHYITMSKNLSVFESKITEEEKLKAASDILGIDVTEKKFA